jgi:hypothetical protein
LALSRRGPLSDLERQALAAHLSHCELCGVATLAAELLRSDPRVAPDAESDRALVARVAEKVSSSEARTARPSRATWRQVAVAAMVLLSVGSGAFAWIGRRPPAPRTVAPMAPAGARPHTTVKRVAREPAATEAPTESPPPSPSPTPTPRRRAVTTPRAEPDPGEALEPPATPASLFAEANGERRHGNLRRAVTLYETLRARFPESDQARLSSISVGDLLLGLGEPARALRAFDSYLAEVRGGALGEEAVFGRARCLRELGDAPREVETWQGLVRDFPGSAYAPIARRRLAELRAADEPRR